MGWVHTSSKCCRRVMGVDNEGGLGTSWASTARVDGLWASTARVDGLWASTARVDGLWVIRRRK